MRVLRAANTSESPSGCACYGTSCRAAMLPQATHGIKNEVDSQHSMLDRMVRCGRAISAGRKAGMEHA